MNTWQPHRVASLLIPVCLAHFQSLAALSHPMVTEAAVALSVLLSFHNRPLVGFIPATHMTRDRATMEGRADAQAVSDMRTARAIWRVVKT